MSDSVSILQRVTRSWEAAQSIYSPFFLLVERELAFSLKLKHHLNERGATLDKRLVQYRGREHFRAIYRNVAQVMAAPIYIEALPSDDMNAQKALAAEDSKWALEWDVRDPLKGFDVKLERALIGMFAARVWYMALDWDPDLGQFGDTVVRCVDPQHLFIAPPFQDVYDPQCPWVGEEVQMRLADARSMEGWKNTDRLLADDAARTKWQSMSTDTDENGRVWTEQAAIPEGPNQVKGTVTILKWWYRRDPDRVTKTQKRPDSEKALAPSDQFDACTKCGYQSPPVGEMQTATPPDGADAQEPGLPGTVCPDCLEKGEVSTLHRITHTVTHEEVLQYPDGRLVIVAPYSLAVLYDGPWPYKLPCPPYMKLGCFEHPRDNIGLSETTLNRDIQIISNALKMRLYDSVMAAPNIILLPGGGSIKSAAGAPFQLTDEPWQVAYYDEPVTGQGIQHFQAPPVSAALFQAINVLDQSFRADIGTSELSAPSGNANDLKGVPVGTVQAFVESGNIGVDHHIKRLRTNLSVFFTCWHLIQQQMWSAARLVRTRGANGVWAAKRMRGASLPSVDIRVTAEPEFKARTKEELDTINAWMHDFGGSETVAQMLHIPPSIVQRFQKEKQETPPPPKVDLDGLGQVLASAAKSGLPVAPNQWEAYLQMVGLPAPEGAGAGVPPQGGMDIPAQPGAGVGGPPALVGMNGPQG